MSAVGPGTMESWAWRALMPALLVGGNAAGWTLGIIFLLRLYNARQDWREGDWNWGAASIWWMAYFVFLLIGGAWSEDLSAWALSLEVKTTLWFLPLVLALPGRRVQSDFWWSVGWSMTAFLTWRMLRAGTIQWAEGTTTAWRYAHFAGDVHPTYLGMHVAVALLGLGHAWAKGIPKPLLWGLTVLFAVSLGLTGSKAGIVAAAAVGMLRVSAALWPREKAAVLSTMPGPVGRWLGFLLMLVVASWWMSGSRFEEMGSAAAVLTTEEAPVTSSSSGRVMVWKASWELLVAHPFGVGTGDVVPALMEIYDRDGIDYAATRRLNPHNQWLQAGVALGWPGVILLSLALMATLRWAWRHGDGLLWLGVILIGLHAMVESVLEVQRGVVFIMWLFMVRTAHSEGR